MESWGYSYVRTKRAPWNAPCNGSKRDPANGHTGEWETQVTVGKVRESRQPDLLHARVGARIDRPGKIKKPDRRKERGSRGNVKEVRRDWVPERLATSWRDGLGALEPCGLRLSNFRPEELTDYDRSTP